MAEIAQAVEPGDDPKNQFVRGGWLSYASTALSMTVCYLKSISAALLPMLGADWHLNSHFQAALMWSLGLIAVFAVRKDTKRHGDRYPLSLLSR